MNNKNLDIQSNRDLFDWIIANKPESEQPAKFYSYEFLFYAALGLRENPGETLTAQDLEEIIVGDLERIYEELWNNHDIAVQMKAVEGGRTGIRIMNTL